MREINKDTHIAIIGLGYVGLPLAVAFAKYFKVTGFDTNPARIAELDAGFDSTLENSEEELKEVTNNLSFSSEAAVCQGIYHYRSYSD
jgi:UDP-N-acetyl-D-galactosamine dehydrogenase